MGLLLRANKLNRKVYSALPRKGLLQRSLEYSFDQSDQFSESINSRVEVIEQIEEFSIKHKEKLNQITVYEENEFSFDTESLGESQDIISGELCKKQDREIDGNNEHKQVSLPSKLISNRDDFIDELSHQLIRSLEKGQAFFIIKISINKLLLMINQSVAIDALLSIIQKIMIDIGKAYLFKSETIILVINKMYKPDPDIFLHQFKRAIRKNLTELENVSDLELNPIVRIFPEDGRNIQDLINGLLE
ncbi:MAG: hypothetical protein JXR70_08065 [Spirochaetales bacterium]|nr:hypothetical protein [Spirochaetales bacterium]